MEVRTNNIEQRKPVSTNGGHSDLFEELLDQYEYSNPKKGQILKGEILRIENNAVFVDVGAKRDAIVPHDEVAQFDPAFLDSISRGSEVQVYVMRTPVGDQELLVSLERGLENLDWEKAEQLEAEDESLELEVIGYNKGGVVVDFGRLRGFVPNSHVPELKPIGDPIQRTNQKKKMIDSKMTVKIIEVDRERRRLVMSARAASGELRQKQLEQLEAGQTVTGRVVHLTNYGAFVNLGHVTGLLHISEISWVHLNHPAEALAVGDEINVLIKRVDVEKEKISLSRKDLLPDPWHQFAQQNEVDDLVEGKVTSLVDFGAFARVASGIEGLIHISEMDLFGDASPEDALEVDQTVLAKIVSIQPDQRRLGLSLRRVDTEEQIAWMAARHVDEEEE